MGGIWGWGIGLMTIFNLIALHPMSGEAIVARRGLRAPENLTQKLTLTASAEKSANPEK